MGDALVIIEIGLRKVVKGFVAGVRRTDELICWKPYDKLNGRFKKSINLKHTDL